MEEPVKQIDKALISRYGTKFPFSSQMVEDFCDGRETDLQVGYAIFVLAGGNVEEASRIWANPSTSDWKNVAKIAFHSDFISYDHHDENLHLK